MAESPLHRSVTEALNSLSVSALKVLSSSLPDTRSYTKKAEIVGEILPYLAGDQLRSLWKRLDKLQKAAVAQVVHSEGFELDLNRFVARYGKRPSMGTASVSSLLNLFFYNGYMPATMKAELSHYVPAPEPDTVAAVDEIPETSERAFTYWDNNIGKEVVKTTEVNITQRHTETDAHSDIAAMLNLVLTGKVRCSEATMAPSSATEKLVAASLTGGDWYDDVQVDDDLETLPPGAIKAFAWPMLLQAAGLATIVSGKLTISPKGLAALTAARAETLKSIWKSWLSFTGFDELRRIDVIKGQTGRGKSSLTPASKRRQAIAEALIDCPVGKWVEIGEFYRIIESSHSFNVTRDIWSLYIYSPDYGTMAGMEYIWNLLEGRYILCLLFEYAATLGIVDVAYTHPVGALDDYEGEWGTEDLESFSRYDGLAYIRVNPLGAYCLGASSSYSPPAFTARKTLRVLPNNDVVVIEPPLPASDGILLAMYAVSSSEGVWRLERDKLLVAIEKGQSIDQLRTFLQDRVFGDIPDTVNRLLDETEERGRKLRDCGTAQLFECTDPHVRTLILNDRRTKSLCYPAGDQFIAVPTDKVKAFAKAVRDLGYILPM